MTETEAPETPEVSPVPTGQPVRSPDLFAETVPVPCSGGMAGPFPCLNVDLESVVPLGGAGLGSGNDIWGWTDPETDREYAIVGSALETTFIDVTDPQNPVSLGALPTSGIPDFVLWRDIKVNGNYAYIVAEVTNHGMQVFDLTRLRNAGPLPEVFTADAVYTGADDQGVVLGNAHNISINEETDFAYIIGSNTCVSTGPGAEGGGLHMVDISKPDEPEFAGCALVEDPASNNYAHDVQCVIYRGPDATYHGREICFGSNENVVTIYDVTDKGSPVVISQAGYPQAAYTHQGWLTDDQRFFIFGDELDEQNGTVDNTTTYILDVSNLDVLKVPKAFAHATNSIDHNLYINNGLIYQANYGAGLRILDFDTNSLANGQLNEVGFFDIRPGLDPAEFVGTWSNYPFFKSGIVVLTGIEEGSSVLYVVRPTGEAAGEGGEDPGGNGGGTGGQGGNQGGGNQGGGSPSDDGQRGATVKGGVLSVTGAQIILFLVLGLALISAGALIQKLRRRGNEN